jgi:GDP-D-mannose 3', 5'-epimerase
MSKKILVTGGAGFIGGHLVDRLISEGFQVTVIDNFWRGKRENLLKDAGESVCEIIEADLAQPDQANKLIKGYDWVIHLADIVCGVNFALANELFIFHQNILINTNVLNACIVNGVENYVYVGTACSYPKHLQDSYDVTTLKEDQTYPAEPESSYGWSKLMGEYEALLALSEKRLNIGVLRLHNVYGERAEYLPGRSQVIPSLIYKAVSYPEVDYEVWGSGQQYRDFIHVQDVVRGICSLMDKGMNQGLIQIGSGVATSIRNLCETIIETSEKDITPTFTLQMPEGDRGRIADYSLAKQILGWEPQIGLKEGISRTYEWIEAKMACTR